MEASNPLDSELLQGFYLGDLLVEPLEGSVTGPDGSTHIPPKAVEVLLCLAQSPGELVTRETLLDCAWGEDSGSQEALSHAVSELRHALGDHFDHPQFVQTLPRRGYRLVVTPRPRDDHSLSDDYTSSIMLGMVDSPQGVDLGLLENLSRRGVIETGIAYLIAGWLLIQVADIVFEQLLFPLWTGTFVTVLVIAGFPVAIVLSWFLDLRDGRAVLDTSPIAVRRRRFSRTYLSIVASLTIAACAVYVYDRFVGLPGHRSDDLPATLARLEPPPVLENSLAVLPFLNLDGSNETRLFADGLVDAVIHQFTRIPGLKVAARGDSFSLDPNSPSALVRERLRVEMYIEGSVEMTAQNMRVLMQLIDSKTGHHILSRKFDRPREEFFEIRDEITDLTVANVRVALPKELRSSALLSIEDAPLNAYTLYRRGKDASHQPATIDAVLSALAWFDAALNLDPEYTAALAGKCDAYVVAYRLSDDEAYIDKAHAACERALALNPNLDMVHVALGNLHRFTGNYGESEASYLRALANDPSSVDALTGLGRTYQRLNRIDMAEESLRTAVDIHPGNVTSYYNYGIFLFQTGRYADAVRQFEYVIALDPNHVNGLTNLASSYMLQGNFAAAEPAFQRAIDLEPTKLARSNLGLLYYYMGRLQPAIDNLRAAVRLAPIDYLAHSNLGDALWAAGRQEDARLVFETANILANNALRINPGDPFTLMDLAWIQTSLGRVSDAKTFIERALSLAPDDPYVHYIHGLILNRSNDPAAAVDALRQAVNQGYPAALLAQDPNLKNLKRTWQLDRASSGAM